MGAGDPRATHPVVWASAAACAAVVVVAGLLPGFTVSVGAYIGAGGTQRSLPDYERTYALLGHGHPRYLAAVAAMALVIAAAAWGWRRAHAWVPAALILAAALAALSLTSAALRESNGPFGGVFLSDAVGEVRSLAENSRESRHPQFGASGYSARPEIGWWLTQGALYALLLISSIALGRSVPRPVPVVAGLAALALAIIFMIPGENCGGEELGHDPDSNPLGLLAVFSGLACSGLGIGALSRRARAVGVLAVPLGLVAAFVAVVVIAFRDCAFY